MTLETGYDEDLQQHEGLNCLLFLNSGAMDCFKSLSMSVFVYDYLYLACLLTHFSF